MIFFKKAPPYNGLIEGNEYPLSRNKTILESLLVKNADVPYNCQVGACKKCMLKIDQGEAKSLIDLGYCLTQEQVDKGYVLACQAIPKSNIVASFYREGSPDNNTVPIESKIISIERLSAYVYRVRLPYMDIVCPGQSFELSVPELNIKRYYSVSAIENNKSIAIDVALKSKGGCSGWLCEQENINKPIHINSVNGGFGDFSKKSDQIVAVAGGSALGMILSVLEEKLLNNADISVNLIHAVRFRKDSYDEKRIHNLRSVYKKFNFYGLLSQEEEEFQGFFRGRAPEFLQSLFSENKVEASSNFLMCGSDSLIKSCMDVLSFRKVESQYCEIESFGS